MFQLIDYLLSNSSWTVISSILVIASSAIFLLLKSVYAYTRKSRFYKKSSPLYQTPSDVDQNSQTKILPGPELIHYSILAKNECDFVSTLENGTVTNFYELFSMGLKLSQNGPCLGTRKDDHYEWISYWQVLEKAKNFGSGLLRLGLKSGQNTFVGIYSQNRYEWDVSALACSSYSMVVVPLYDSLGAEAVSYIVNQADIELVICDTTAKLKKLLDNAGTMPNLKFIICMDIESADDKNGLTKLLNLRSSDLKVISFKDIELAGAANIVELNLPIPEDIYIICYTSGTTGNPKGVLISHGNIICQLAAFKCMLDKYGIRFDPKDAAISYLPMAHMFGQIIHAMCFFYGARVGYISGDVSRLLNDMQILKPRFLPVVPRLLNRLHDNVRTKMLTSNFLVRALYNVAYYFKSRDLAKGIIRRDTIWDKLVFRKIQNLLGGNVTFVVTGTAPILPEVKQFTWTVLGSLLLEAYGQTEVTAAVTVTLPNDISIGHVGACLPNCLIKLVDVPELEYFAKKNQGEICIKGPGFPMGYFKEPEKTAELFDRDGWLHTGDVGSWTPRGTLSIIDRKKNILKLAQGEYVAPEKIENVYSLCSSISQIFVDGSSLQTYLVAIVVPNKTEIKRKMANDEFPFNLQFSDTEQFWQNETLNKAILEDMRAIGKQNGLNSLEQVKAIKFCIEQFSLENGLLTPTMKLKRPQLRKKFASTVENLYLKPV